MPRHPPCALNSLSHKHTTTTTNAVAIARFMIATQDNLRSIVDTHHAHALNQRTSTTQLLLQDARVHYPVHKQPAHQARATSHPASSRPRRHPPKRQRSSLTGLIPQTPNSVPTHPPPARPPGSTPADPRRDQHGSTEVTDTRRVWFIDDSTSETPPA